MSRMIRRSHLACLAPFAALALAGCELWSTPDLAGSPVEDAGGFADAPFLDAPVNVLDAPGTDAFPDNTGFTLPTAPTRANERVGGTWTEVGDADWTCMAAPRVEPTPSTPYLVRGTVRDFQSTNAIGGAVLRLFDASNNVLGSAVSESVAASRGTYQLQAAQALPPGSTRVMVVVEAAGARPTFSVDRYLGPAPTVSFDPISMSESTVQALPAFVGRSVRPGTSLVIGSIRDCRGRMVSNAAVTVSQFASVAAHVPGAETFYFSAGSNSLPVRHNVAASTNRDGRFMVLDLEALGVPGFVQVWGFRTLAELQSGTLTLLGRSPAILSPDAVTTVDTEPLRP